MGNPEIDITYGICIKISPEIIRCRVGSTNWCRRIVISILPYATLTEIETNSNRNDKVADRKRKEKKTRCKFN